MKTVTFHHNKGFQFTVKSSFIDKCGPIEILADENIYELMEKKGMKYALHNEVGPAVIDLNWNTHSFWINGKPVSKDQQDKIEHTMNFKHELDNILKGE